MNTIKALLRFTRKTFNLFLFCPERTRKTTVAEVYSTFRTTAVSLLPFQ